MTKATREDNRLGLRRVIAVLLGRAWAYLQRLGRWVMVLGSMRGATLLDETKLVASALAAPFTSLRNLTEWQDPILLFDATVLVRGIGRFRLRKRSDDLFHVLPWRERSVIRFHREVLKPGDTYIDAGANIGFYTVPAARAVGVRGKVVAVEMMPDTAEILREHLRINEIANASVVESALAGSSGQVVNARVKEGHFGQATIANGVINGQFREEKVNTTTLADIVKGVGHVSLLKLDLEGMELEVLCSAGVLLSDIDAIVFEEWEMPDGTVTPTRYLQDRGFVVTKLDARNKVAVKHLR